METIVLITGGFDPLHSGHIAYINAAAKMGDRLIVGVNSDAWLSRKKGKPFLPWKERALIVSNLRSVDEVISFNDEDGTAIDAIRKIKEKYTPFGSIIVFANGGDRTRQNIPEMAAYANCPEVKFMFGVGGTEKDNSSSQILYEWENPKVLRPWGWFRVLHSAPGVKVKELLVSPGASLSMQRHNSRSEHWFVAEGAAVANLLDDDLALITHNLVLHSHLGVPARSWHQLTNPYSIPCKIVELQYGNLCVEEDIERMDYGTS